MKSLLIALLALGIAGCSNTSNNTNSQVEDKKTTAYVDTLLYVSNLIVDSVPFIKLQMNPENAYVSMADSVMPSESDSTIALCVEAAFTGELLKNFTTINIAGDYVIDGNFRKGYKCKANTGFLYADRNVVTISSSDHCAEWIGKAKVNSGTLFQQMLLVQNGKNVYRGRPIKPVSRNIYRAACILNNGEFAVIQSEKQIPLNDFINNLVALGVTDALYLDVGTGWNYGWYRTNSNSTPVKLFNARSPYQTNWLIIRARK